MCPDCTRELFPRRFKFSRENLNLQQIIGSASGKLKSSAEKIKVPLEIAMFR